MTQNTVPLPEPVALVVQKVIRGRKGAPDTYKYDFVLCDPTLRPCKLYTADQMHAHAAKVCAEKDAEIERLSGRQSQMTTEQVVIIARVMADIQAAACNVDVTDNWAIYGEEFLSDARVIADELNRAALKEPK